MFCYKNFKYVIQIKEYIITFFFSTNNWTSTFTVKFIYLVGKLIITYYQSALSVYIEQEKINTYTILEGIVQVLCTGNLYAFVI